MVITNGLIIKIVKDGNYQLLIISNYYQKLLSVITISNYYQ